MNKHLIRFVTLLLVPCLVTDPLTAAAYPNSRQSMVGISLALFKQQAIPARLRQFLKEPRLDIKRLAALQMRVEADVALPAPANSLLWPSKFERRHYSGKRTDNPFEDSGEPAAAPVLIPENFRSLTLAERMYWIEKILQDPLVNKRIYPPDLAALAYCFDLYRKGEYKENPAALNALVEGYRWSVELTQKEGDINAESEILKRQIDYHLGKMEQWRLLFPAEHKVLINFLKYPPDVHHVVMVKQILSRLVPRSDLAFNLPAMMRSLQFPLVFTILNNDTDIIMPFHIDLIVQEAKKLTPENLLQYKQALEEFASSKPPESAGASNQGAHKLLRDLIAIELILNMPEVEKQSPDTVHDIVRFVKAPLFRMVAVPEKASKWLLLRSWPILYRLFDYLELFPEDHSVMGFFVDLRYAIQQGQIYNLKLGVKKRVQQYFRNQRRNRPIASAPKKPGRNFGFGGTTVDAMVLEADAALERDDYISAHEMIVKALSLFRDADSAHRKDNLEDLDRLDQYDKALWVINAILDRGTRDEELRRWQGVLRDPVCRADHEILRLSLRLASHPPDQKAPPLEEARLNSLKALHYLEIFENQRTLGALHIFNHLGADASPHTVGYREAREILLSHPHAVLAFPYALWPNELSQTYRQLGIERMLSMMADPFQIMKRNATVLHLQGASPEVWSAPRFQGLRMVLHQVATFVATSEVYLQSGVNVDELETMERPNILRSVKIDDSEESEYFFPPAPHAGQLVTHDPVEALRQLVGGETVGIFPTREVDIRRGWEYDVLASCYLQSSYPWNFAIQLMVTAKKEARSLEGIRLTLINQRTQERTTQTLQRQSAWTPDRLASILRFKDLTYGDAYKIEIDPPAAGSTSLTTGPASPERSRGAAAPSDPSNSFFKDGGKNAIIAILALGLSLFAQHAAAQSPERAAPPSLAGASAQSLLPPDVPSAIQDLQKATAQLNQALADFYGALRPLDREWNQADGRFKFPENLQLRLYATRMLNAGLDPRVRPAWENVQIAKGRLLAELNTVDPGPRIGIQDMLRWAGSYRDFYHMLDEAKKALRSLPADLSGENGRVALDRPDGASEIILMDLGKDKQGNRRFYQAYRRYHRLIRLVDWSTKAKAIITVDSAGRHAAQDVTKAQDKEFSNGGPVIRYDSQTVHSFGVVGLLALLLAFDMYGPSQEVINSLGLVGAAALAAGGILWLFRKITERPKPAVSPPGQVAAGDQYGQSLHPKGVRTPAEPAAGSTGSPQALSGVERAAARALVEKEDLFTHLRWLRDAFNDGIPPIIVSGRDSAYKDYKVRKNWWSGITADLENLLLETLISDAVLVEKIKKFLYTYITEEFINRLTTSQDIKQANKMINDVMRYREKYIRRAA